MAIQSSAWSMFLQHGVQNYHASVTLLQESLGRTSQGVGIWPPGAMPQLTVAVQDVHRRGVFLEAFVPFVSELSRVGVPAPVQFHFYEGHGPANELHLFGLVIIPTVIDDPPTGFLGLSPK